MAATPNVSHLQQRAYAGLFRKLRRRAIKDRHGHVRMVMVGGSVAAGTGCLRGDRNHTQGTSDGECAYAARFGRYLRCAHATLDEASVDLDPLQGIEVVNRALGGTTSASGLPLLPAAVSTPLQQHGDADFLLVDYSTNDAFHHYYYRGHPRSRTLSTGSVQDKESADEVTAATETMLRYLLAEHPQLPIVLVESDCRVPLGRVSSRSAHQIVAERYGVPIVTYAGALNDGVGCASPAWEGQHSSVHPTWQTHASLARLLAEWFETFGSRVSSSLNDVEHTKPVPEVALPSALTSPELRARFAICRSPLTVYDAREAFAASHGQPLSPAAIAAGHRTDVHSKHWLLYEDRPTKPGWITADEFPVNPLLQFDLAFGAQPRLMLVYVMGYEDWGQVELRLGHYSRRGLPHIDVYGVPPKGHVGPNVTQAQLLALDVGQDSEGGRNNHNIPAFSNATLHLKFVSKPPWKFKVLHVSSC